MTDLNKLSKKKLEELGREHGIELDRRLTKGKLIEQLKEVLSEEPKQPAKKEIKVSSNVISSVPREKITFIAHNGGSYLSVDGKTVAEINNRGVVAGLANRYGKAIKVADGVFIIKKG